MKFLCIFLIIGFLITPELLSQEFLLEEDTFIEIYGEKFSKADIEKYIRNKFGNKITQRTSQIGLQLFIWDKVIEIELEKRKIAVTDEEIKAQKGLDLESYLEQYFDRIVQNPWNFSDLIENFVKQDSFLWDKYKDKLATLKLAFKFNKEEIQYIYQIWKDVLNNILLHYKIIEHILKEESMDMNVLNKYSERKAKFKKLLLPEIKEEDIDSFIDSERRALEGGRFDLSVILLFTWDVSKRPAVPFSDNDKENVKKRAVEIKSLLSQDNSNFDDLASKYSQHATAKNRGRIGIVSCWDNKLPFNLRQYAFKLNEGEVSDIIDEPSLGYFILKLNQYIPPLKPISKSTLRERAINRYLQIIIENTQKKWMAEAFKNGYIKMPKINKNE